MTDAFYGQRTLDAHAWVLLILAGLLMQGPQPLLVALDELRPRTRTQKTELRRAKNYFQGHLDCMRYPQLMVMQLPIASGVVEATCRTLVCQRTKNAGMRWTRTGAQAVLNLWRCLNLSHHDHWRAVFFRRPLRRTPRLDVLRQPDPQDA